MSVFDVLLHLSALGIIYTVTGVTSVSVIQIPHHVTQLKGRNVSMYCSSTMFDPNEVVDVYWRRAGQDGTLDSTVDNRKTMKPFKQGSAELHLQNVILQDSGVYYCSVRDGRGKLSNGNGTELIVHVPPSPVKVTRLPSRPLTLLCTTGGFFPEEFTLTWYKNNMKMTSGVNTTERRSEQGLYQVSSSLNPVESGSVYRCEVSHVTLWAPAEGSYTVRDPANGIGRFFYCLVVGCPAGVLILIIVVLVILVKRDKLGRTEGTEISEDIPGHFEEQNMRSGDGESLSYAALNLRKIGEPRHEEDRDVYAQTKQGADGKLTYVSLDFTASQKKGRRKQKETRAEYAEIRINKPSGEFGIVSSPPRAQR